jgi:nicotinamide-nucleotide amidase
VTYANAAKTRLLGVSEATLAKHGAVSEEVVKAMVSGACRESGADLAVAVSGVAGPDGGSADKPVGTVWLAWGDAANQQAECFHFPGDRQAVREQAVRQALAGLVARLDARAKANEKK